MLASRRLITPERKTSSSMAIQKMFISLPLFIEANVIALYSPIHNEVDTMHVINAAISGGKTVLLPAVTVDTIEFRKLSASESLICGAYGIPEPDIFSQVFDVDAVDVIVVPGVAFDINGRRIGYGKGFYDKALHKLEGRGRLVAFSYDFQVLDEIVDEHHDVQIDVIITEKRVIYPLI